jgi:hypothetical protein
MLPRIPAALGAVLATLVPAAGAHAGAVTLDRSCYVEDSTMVATGSGFKPGSQLTLSGDGASQTATADESGAFQVSVKVPGNPSIAARPSSIVSYTLNVQDAGDAAQNTSVGYQVANYAAERGQSSSPRKKRMWYFSGFEPGKPIYAHFRYHGRTQADYRMGTAQGPCGTLSRRAPGIVARHLKAGRWTIQVDQVKAYNVLTTPALIFKTTLYMTRRR